MYTPPPSGDLRGAEQRSREQYAHLENAAARDAQLGIQRPRMRERIRHWYRRLTGRTPAN
jgi:hypothetical protein